MNTIRCDMDENYDMLLYMCTKKLYDSELSFVLMKEDYFKLTN